jgi:hypothetical protein
LEPSSDGEQLPPPAKASGSRKGPWREHVPAENRVGQVKGRTAVPFFRRKQRFIRIPFKRKEDGGSWAKN